MLRHSTFLLWSSGFYIAIHPWLQVAGFVKVGFSSNLEARLHMPTFTTCFTDEWQYHTVFECESHKEALLLEQSVLFCLADRRVLHRELLRASEEEVARVARAVTAKLNLMAVERRHPVYKQPERRQSPANMGIGSMDSNHSDLSEEEGMVCHEPHEDELADGEREDKMRRAMTEAGSSGKDRVAGGECPEMQLTIAPYVDALKSVRAFLERKRSRGEAITDARHTGSLRAGVGVDDGIHSASLLAKRRSLLIGSDKQPDSRVCASTSMPSAAMEAEEDGAMEGNADEGDDAVALLDVAIQNLSGAARGAAAGVIPGDASLSTLVDADDYSLKRLRPYQEEAVSRVRAELAERGNAICQMACRCGKTPVAFTIMREYVQSQGQQRTATGRVLYLVPGLFLLRQTALKLYGYGFQGVPMLLIGSDANPVFLGMSNSGTTVAETMTTDPAQIHEFLLHNSHCVVVSTYHSSPLLARLTNMFCLTVFDECHRVCGSSERTPFNTLLMQLPPAGSKRLFLTATPTYDTPIRMSDDQLFGGIAYRYYLREGIDAGYVNPFCVRVVLGHSLDDLSPHIMEAMCYVDKMLIFCRNIEHAETLYEQLATAAPQLTGEGGLHEGTQPFAAFIAHSRMGSGQVSAALADFASCRRCVLVNVRMFQEGVEIPDLNAVFFAAPRYSSRDIIQSVCRPLNRLPNKPISYVFLPAAFDRRHRADHPINLENFSTLVPFTDALMDEDPTLFEYMIDPQKKSYDFDVVGLRSLKLTSEKLHKFVLPAVRRGVRYSCTTQTDRLHRAARLPWKYVFGEMRRIVMECHRYPKTNDAWVVGDTSVSMNLFYRYARKGYALFQAGQQTFLQTYQLRDLESLPKWGQYGVEGPYPWRECLETLEKHLRRHGKVPPLDVHKGGFVGLDATPFERLSGCLMHINQCDGKRELRLAEDKQRDLDELCARYKLKWRKSRNADGTLRKNERTFITDSFIQFKSLLERKSELPSFQAYLDKHYPGYPEKHTRMENLDILREGKVPPRHQPMRRVPRKMTPDVNRTKKTQVARGGKGSAAALAPGTKKRGGQQRLQPAEPIRTERSVMCRICRLHVPTAVWQQHLASSEHQAAATSHSSTDKGAVRKIIEV